MPRTRGGTGHALPELGLASAIDIAAGLHAGEWTSCEVIEWHLKRIERFNGPYERYEDNGGLNAFIRTFPDMARTGCSEADRIRNHAAWAGVPIALKDAFDVEGMPASGGTPAFRSYRADRDCMLSRKWRKAGAVLLGHTQSQRFLDGLTTPQTANPWNPRLIAGGSSGGSAAAVAAGMIPTALGSETDGSLIYPAACCGVTTLKPSHGLLSLDGVYPGLPSFDVVGPIARTAADCAWAMATLAPDDPEITWPDIASSRTGSERPFRGLRFLVSSNERYSNLRTREATAVDPRVQRCFDTFLKSLQALGAEIVLAQIPHDLGRYGAFRTEADARMGGMSAFQLLETNDCITAHYPGLYRRLARASDSERDIAVKHYHGSGTRLESNAFLDQARRVTAEAIGIATQKRDDFRRSWQEVLARHGCDAHVYLEIGSPLPERRGIEDTPAPNASRNGVVPCDLGWPVLSLPVGMAAGLDAPVSAQIMARRWHDHRLLLWGMEWQRRHLTAVGFPPVEPAIKGQT